MTLIRGAGFDETSTSWHVPSVYNAAVDSMDHHPTHHLAMIWCDYTGRSRQVTWDELRGRSHQFARIFLDHGVRRGDVVAVLLPQVPEAAAAYAGALRVGAVLLTMSLAWSEQQILGRLEDAEAKVLVTDNATIDSMGGLGRGTDVVLLNERTFDGVSLGKIEIRTSAEDPAHLYYTSGTTGPAKALVHAQRSLVGHNEFEVAHALQPGDLFYGGGEWAWSHAKLFGPWRYGAVQFVYAHEASFDADGLLVAAAKHRVVSSLLSPTLIKAIRRTASESALARPWAFRTVCSSNEPLDPGTNDWFSDVFGCPVREYYGLTESYPMIGYRADEPVVRGSTGRIMPGWDVRLSGHDASQGSAPAPPGGEALLRARSNPQYPLGYWGLEDLSRRTFGGEWFATGDTFEVDAEGYWYFLGRNDDVIKTSGYRVGPAEIEAVLESHEAVLEASVIGIPDHARGQAVCAYIVPHPSAADQTELTEHLQRYVRDRYSRFAYPRVIYYVEGLPKSSTGKVQRSQLRAWATEEDPNAP